MNAMHRLACLPLLAGLLFAAPAAAAPPADPLDHLWPVAVARDGFTAQRSEYLLAGFDPFKLTRAGNQALYSYLNMPAFFPHHLVAAQGEITTLPPRPRTGAHLLSLRVEAAQGTLSLTELLADPQSRVQGLLILHRGQVVVERYPGMRREDSHLWWSVAKLLAGTIVAGLLDEGAIDGDRDIVAYLPEFAGSGWEGASVEHVLNMASGIDALDSAAGYADPDSGIGRLIYAEGILQRSDGVEAVGHDRALQLMTSARPPGTRYEYASPNTNMLALLIERVTGRRYADVVQQRIWSRIGAEGDGLLGLSPDGRPIAHGMYSSRLRDLARFGLLFTPSGQRADVLSKRALARMTDPDQNAHFRTATAVIDHLHAKLGERPVNALAQWDAIFADGDLFKSGYDGQALYVSPQQDLVIAVFSTSKDKRIYRYLRPLAAAVAAEADRRP